MTEQEPSVCIQDFCGSYEPGHLPIQFWADYFPQRDVTVFGGYWHDVPDMPSETEPTEEQVQEWAETHGRRMEDYPEYVRKWLEENHD